MNEEKESFETRVARLEGYLTRAYEYNKPSILFALYLSEFQRVEVEKTLEKLLKEQGLEIGDVDAGKHKNLPDHLASRNSKNIVFFVHNVEKGFPDSLQYLNFKRETIAENHIKVIFWVTEKELTRISRDAPDFFAFRNRVVAFMEVPLKEDRRPDVVDFALETEYKSLDEIKSSIELKEKLLAELSGDDEISGFLLGSLGVLYDQIGSYKKAIQYLEKALAISQEIGDRRGEGSHLNSLGFAIINENKYKEALACYLLARDIRTQIKDPNLKTTEDNIKALKDKLGENKFKELEAEVMPEVAEIVKKMLEKSSV
jgi:tetratricopeptide (TPR) repeat protein